MWTPPISESAKLTQWEWALYINHDSEHAANTVKNIFILRGNFWDSFRKFDEVPLKSPLIDKNTLQKLICWDHKKATGFLFMLLILRNKLNQFSPVGVDQLFWVPSAAFLSFISEWAGCVGAASTTTWSVGSTPVLSRGCPSYTSSLSTTMQSRTFSGSSSQVHCI